MQNLSDMKNKAVLTANDLIQSLNATIEDWSETLVLFQRRKKIDELQDRIEELERAVEESEIAKQDMMGMIRMLYKIQDDLTRKGKMEGDIGVLLDHIEKIGKQAVPKQREVAEATKTVRYLISAQGGRR
jgi:hypothetical protein